MSITPVGFSGFGDAASEVEGSGAQAAAQDALSFARHLKIPNKVAVAVLAALGADPDEMELVLVEDLALTPESTITDAIASLTLGAGDEAIAATAIQKGQALRFFRSAKLKATQQGLGDVPAPIPPAAAPTKEESVPPAMAVVTKKTNEVLDQVDDSVFPVLPPAKIAEFRDHYVAVMHGEPDDAQRPTADQLSALAHRLSRGSAPYVDLGLFGPFGDRIARIRKFSGQVWVDNELKTAQVSGPRSYDAWLGSWELFKAAMIMLDAAGVAALDKYARGIQRLVELHGNWSIIMLADERCRAERWEILAEKYARDPPAHYKASRPWDSIIADAAYSLHGPMSEWWYFSVVAPLTYKVNAPMAQVNLFEGTVGTIMETTTSAVTGKPLNSAQSNFGHGGPKAKKQKTGGSGGPSSSRTQSNEVCMNWNNGGCSDPCLAGRRHVCSICGANHKKTDCHQVKSAAANKGGGKGPSAGHGGGAPTNKAASRSKRKAGGKGGSSSKK